jgi:hypothetical protein
VSTTRIANPALDTPHEVIHDNDKIIPLLDPTINVQNLLQAAVMRQNDLREAETHRIDERFDKEQKRINEMVALRADQLVEISTIRADYERLLTGAEAKRIDAIRAVDVAAVQVERERAYAQAAVLATQVSNSADTLRASMASNAAALATQLSGAVQTLSDRISTLERTSYEGQGKEKRDDPAMARLVELISSMRTELTENRGRGMGANALWGYVIGAIGLIATLGSIIVVASKLP